MSEEGKDKLDIDFTIRSNFDLEVIEKQVKTLPGNKTMLEDDYVYLTKDIQALHQHMRLLLKCSPVLTKGLEIKQDMRVLESPQVDGEWDTFCKLLKQDDNNRV